MECACNYVGGGRVEVHRYLLADFPHMAYHRRAHAPHASCMRLFDPPRAARLSTLWVIRETSGCCRTAGGLRSRELQRREIRALAWPSQPGPLWTRSRALCPVPKSAASPHRAIYPPPPPEAQWPQVATVPGWARGWTLLRSTVAATDADVLALAACNCCPTMGVDSTSDGCRPATIDCSADRMID